MTDGESLRQAVFDTPWDDALRLVYADWLMEHGDEEQRALGDFIRVSTRMEQKRTRELMEEYGRLLTAHKDQWLRHVPERLPRSCVDFRGGFVRDARLTTTELLAYGPRLAEHYPIDSLCLTTFPTLKNALQLVAAPLRLERLRTLWLCGPFGTPSGPMTLMGLMPNLLHVQLSIERPEAHRVGRIDADSIRFLTDWPGLARLRSLTIRRVGLDADAAAALFRQPALATVGELMLEATGLNDAWARPLLTSPFADGTGTLYLRYNFITEPVRAQLRGRYGERVHID